jgi:hypothetical protein
MQKLSILLFFLLAFINLNAQKSSGQPPKATAKPSIPKDSTYLSNIKKSNLYGVYIPRDIDDAMSKLMELTTDEARKPMLRIHEDTLANKLHFGLGRWMEYNWNFVEGSRFSHYLRQKGLTYPDDMVHYMLVLFHRHVSGRPMDADPLAAKIVEERNLKIKKDLEKRAVIKSEIKKSN